MLRSKANGKFCLLEADRDRTLIAVKALTIHSPNYGMVWETEAMRKTLVSVLTTCLMFTISPAWAATTSFTLGSPVVGEMGTLPALYTCDGASVSPPLQWSNAPKGTKYFALTMFTIPKDGPDHWYFTIWDIPAKVSKLPQGDLNIGQVGGNGENPKIGYAPPCSQGPGIKKYAFSLYALSRSANLGHSSASVTRADLLSAISKITLAQATFDVTYSRPNGATHVTPAP